MPLSVLTAARQTGLTSGLDAEGAAELVRLDQRLPYVERLAGKAPG